MRAFGLNIRPRNREANRVTRSGRRPLSVLLGAVLAAGGIAALLWLSARSVQAEILHWLLDTQADWNGYAAVKTNTESTVAGDLRLLPAWTTQTSNTTYNIIAVDMLSTTSGFAVSNNGTNSDMLSWNGTSWSKQTITNRILYDLDMVSGTSGYAVGNDGWARDAFYYWNGTTWGLGFTNKAGQIMYTVSMLTNDFGWMAGKNGAAIYCTSACGTAANWTTWGSTFSQGDVWSMHLLSTTSGWAVGKSTAIYMYNGGTSWTKLNSTTSPKNPLDGNGAILYSIRAVSANDAWAVGQSGKVLYFNGTDWEDRTAHVNKNITMYSVYPLDSNNDGKTDDVWIVGSGGNIGHGTACGGTPITCTWSWITAPDGFTGNLRDLFVHSPDAGWAVGDSGRLYRYGFPASGTAEYTFDAGQTVKWVSHSYAATPGATGSVSFEWAYSTDGTNWSAWQGTLPTSSNTRYLKQRISLSTTDWAQTPLVHASDVTYNTDITPPAAPTGLSATAGDGQVTLSWTANSEPDMAGYNIYRSSDGTSYTKVNGDPVADTTYVATGLTNGQQYWFKITAVDTAGNESAYSSTVTATPVNVAPAVPTGLTATEGDRQATLSWTANTEWDLAGYNIYRADSAAGPYTKINSTLVTTAAYVDDALINGTTYWYRVTAVDSTALESAQSAEVGVTPRDYVAPAAPSGVTAAEGDRQVTLNWSANSEYDLTGYNIYRSSDNGATFAKIASVSPATTSYLDADVVNGVYYWYKITATDTSTNESAYSDVVIVMPRDYIAPATPIGLSAYPRAFRVVLSWTANTEYDIKGYNIYRATDEAGPFTKVNSTLVTGTEYYDNNLTNNTTYWYRITAVDTSTNESPQTAAVTATPVWGAYSGPQDTKVEVTTMGGIRTARIMFTAEDSVSYTVYKHAYGDGRTFHQVGGSVYYSGGVLTTDDPNWGYLPVDSTAGYVYYNDTAIVDYEEYYYFVRADADPAWPVNELTGRPQPPLEDYVVARAFPPAQAPHGDFNEFTGACTVCHGLHSSLSAKLLKAATVTDLCGSCHDGSASKYDVVMGRVRTGPDWNSYLTNAAGAFGTQLKNVAGAPVMNSLHNVWRSGLTADGTAAADSAQHWQAPGSTYLSKPSTDPGTWTKAFTCAGCHEPHNRSKNFRLLRSDFNTGTYNLPDNQGAARTGVVVRGVTEINLGYPGGGQMASRYLAGNPAGTAGGINGFCSGCHRAFAGPFNEKYPTLAPGYDPSSPQYRNTYDYTQKPGDTNADNDALDNPGTHGWKRHFVGMPASNALLHNGFYIVDPGETGATGEQDRLIDWNGSNLGNYVPLEGPYTDDGIDSNGNEYAENRVVCLTCHVAHGSPRAAGGIGPDGEIMDLENAYRNDKLNNTNDMPANDGYEENQATGYEKGRHPISGYLHNRNNGLIIGSSSVLARYEPFASVCWRCHSTR